MGEKKISYCKVNKSMNFCECRFAFLYKFRGTPSEKSLFFPCYVYIYLTFLMLNSLLDCLLKGNLFHSKNYSIMVWYVNSV